MAIFGGRMRPYKTRNGFNYELNDSLMLKVIADLIRHKLVLNHRRKQFNRTWAPTLNVAQTKPARFVLRQTSWLSGFTFGDGSLQIKVVLL